MKPDLRLRLHATQAQPCFPAASNALALPGGNGIFTATPTERITHYLYDNIRDVLTRYRADTGDKKIHLLKYHKMMNMAPDTGACFHPSISRQKKMAVQLADFLRGL